jgi:MFS family permease
MHSKRNFNALIWHSVWLAFTTAFADHNTVLPGLILRSGGLEWHLGLLTAIMLGIPLLSQLVFAGFLSSREHKKPYLLTGIYMRVAALAGLFATIHYYQSLSLFQLLLFVYISMLFFSVSGAFAGLTYNDIVGKSLDGDRRRRFVVFKQFMSSSGFLLSAILAREILLSFEYPENYQILFFFATVFLAVASLGFWRLQEPASESIKSYTNPLKLILQIPILLRADRNLRFFILLANIAGAAITLIPFYISLAVQEYSIQNISGELLMFHFAGMAGSNILWSRIVKKRGFKGAFYSVFALQAIIPVTMLLISSEYDFAVYRWMFLLSGAAFSAYKMAIEGVLLEISTNENRIIYSGIFGIFNVLTALAPIVAGILIPHIGYAVVFGVIAVLSLLSLFGVKQLNCKMPDLR